MSRTLPPFRVTLLAVLTALLAAVFLHVDAARAGGYDVFACNGFGGGSASFGSVADGGMSAYHECHGGEGMIARNALESGQGSGFLQGAYQIFDAPPGTIVESIHSDARLHRPDCRWALHLLASGSDLGGRVLWGLGAPGDPSCGMSGWAGGHSDSAVKTGRAPV